ncbi:hypothetical protein [Neorhizobium sp. DT-125]|uniref:hypothetical protein n=1 Tax=Neorhizobium sp. DT-125 TaxID=3396163 RepID=UPI003F1ABE2E
MVTTEQTRRSIAERVIARARARGTPIDGDPEYMTIVDAWIAGEISIQEMRQRYIALLQRRSQAFRARTPYHLAMTAIEEEQAGERSTMTEMIDHSDQEEISEGDPAKGGAIKA